MLIRKVSPRAFEWWLDHISSINIDRDIVISKFSNFYLRNYAKTYENLQKFTEFTKIYGGYVTLHKFIPKKFPDGMNR